MQVTSNIDVQSILVFDGMGPICGIWPMQSDVLKVKLGSEQVDGVGLGLSYIRQDLQQLLMIAVHL